MITAMRTTAAAAVENVNDNESLIDNDNILKAVIILILNTKVLSLQMA
nr:MAG TPA: hypothetical protein [Caudoviricetes sp.]